MPAAPRVRRARRQPRGDLRDVALRRVGRQAQGFRPRRPVRRLVPGHAPGPDAELVSAARGRSRDAPAPSDPRRPGGRAAHHQRDVYRLDVAANRAVRPPAADADPELSRPADGEGLSPRARRPTSPRSTSARSAQAASSISPGTSTASSGRCCAWITGSSCATPSQWATNEEPPVEVDRPRRARRDRSGGRRRR